MGNEVVNEDVLSTIHDENLSGEGTSFVEREMWGKE